MTIQVGVGGVYKSVPAVKVGVGGVWKTVSSIKVGVGGVWKVAFSGLTVTLSPGSTASGLSATNPVYTDGVTAVPSGGSSPYTYAWAYVSGDATISCTAPTSATTSWSGSTAANTPKTAVWRVTVTDSTGFSATADCTVTVERSA